MDQGLDIFWKTGTTITDSRINELVPIRVSEPIPFRTMLTSAPTISHRLAMSFMKLIFVASMALAAYLVISAEVISMNMIGCPFNVKGL